MRHETYSSQPLGGAHPLGFLLPVLSPVLMWMLIMNEENEVISCIKKIHVLMVDE